MTGLIDFSIAKPELANALATGYNEAQQQRNTLLQQRQAAQLQGIQIQNALREQQQAADEAAAWKAGAGNPNQVYTNLQQSGLGKQAMALGAQIAKQNADRLSMLKTANELKKTTATAVLANPTLENAIAATQHFAQQTGMDVSGDLAQLQQIGNDPDGIRKWAAGHAVDADKLLPKFQHFDQGGAIVTGKTDPLTGQFIQGDAYKKTATPGELLSHQDRVNRLNAETATGTLSPESIDFAAQMYTQTGQLPAIGIGKGAANIKAQILTRAQQIATAGGKTNEEAAGGVVDQIVGLGGRKASARALGTTGANMTLAANEAQQMIPVAQSYVARLNPGDYPIVNQAGLFAAKNTGDPVQAGLAASLNALVNSYARAITPRGTPTVSDKNHAREVIHAAMSKGQFAEVFNVMNAEMSAAQNALKEVTPTNVGKGGASPGAAKPAASGWGKAEVVK